MNLEKMIQLHEEKKVLEKNSLHLPKVVLPVELVPAIQAINQDVGEQKNPTL